MREKRQILVRSDPRSELSAANQNNARSSLRGISRLASGTEQISAREQEAVAAVNFPQPHIEYMPKTCCNAIAMWISDQVRKAGSLESSEASRKIAQLFGVDFDLVRHEQRPDQLVESVLMSLTEISSGSVGYCLDTGRFQTPGRGATAS